MKVTFVHLGREHLGIEYLSAVLRAAGHETALAYDPGMFGINDNVLHLPPLERWFARREQVINKIVANAPDLVGFSAYTNTYQWCCDIAREVRRRIPAKIAFGGSHPTLVPERVIAKEFVDFVLVGECEEAILELAEALDRPALLATVRNLWLKQNGSVISNPVRPAIANLDDVPLPDRSLFESELRYQDDYMLISSRGCPNNCTYCCEKYLNDLYRHRYFRRRSVTSVMDELNTMHARYGLREVMFFDSILFTDKKWLSEFCARFRNELGIPFRCEGHVNYFDHDVATMLKDGGCYCINFGIQSMNESIRRNVLHRYETNAQAGEAFRLCDEVGIKYDIDLMFDLPGETEADYESAVRFYAGGRELNRLKSYNLTFFPRMPIVDAALAHGLITQREAEGIMDGNVGDMFHTDSVRAPEVRRARANFRFFYKILPLLPVSAVKRILKHKLYRAFHVLPSALAILLEIVVAVKNRDYRYWLYLRHYAHQFRLKLLG
ncbi:MAG: radical SAM protein, partial [Planctomycetes bacterium]|nr:radical SAM protein [Planctomycetota bacterium]